MFKLIKPIEETGSKFRTVFIHTNKKEKNAGTDKEVGINKKVLIQMIGAVIRLQRYLNDFKSSFIFYMYGFAYPSHFRNFTEAR